MNNAQTGTLHDTETNENVQIDFVHLKKAAMILRALNHKLRQQLLLAHTAIQKKQK